MVISRRKFIKDLFTLGASACCTAAFGSLGSQYAFAQSTEGSGKTLILFNQFGGNDPLNSFSIPYTLASYYSKRPNIHIPMDNMLLLNGSNIAFHPSLTNLKRLFEDGDVAVIRGIGDPVGTRSHFTSQDIFSKGFASNAGYDGKGWLGRLGDLYFNDLKYNTVGLSVGSKLDFKSDRGTNTPLALGSLAGFKYDRFTTPGMHGLQDHNIKQEALARLIHSQNPNPTNINKVVDSNQKTVTDAMSEISNALATTTLSGTYDSSNPASSFFEQVAISMNYGLGTKVFYGGLGGWDHHASQGAIEGSQAGLLSLMDQGIGSFEVDAKANSYWDKVAICIFTEFGRKTFENGSGGTDHGWGSTMLVIGGSVNSAILGPEMTDADFSKRWIDQAIDFRNPFSEMISWLGFDPAPVFPETYTKENLYLFT